MPNYTIVDYRPILPRLGRIVSIAAVLFILILLNFVCAVPFFFVIILLFYPVLCLFYSDPDIEFREDEFEVNYGFRTILLTYDKIIEVRRVSTLPIYWIVYIDSDEIPFLTRFVGKHGWFRPALLITHGAINYRAAVNIILEKTKQEA
jgi:hypothetical protein